MKKKLLALLITTTLIFTSYGEQEIVGLPWWKVQAHDRRKEKNGQSFMFTRPLYQNIAAQNAAYWHDAVYEKIGCHLSSVQVMPMYQQSIDSHAPARYFLINQKDTLVVKGDMTLTPSVRDVRAEWLRLPNEFVGNFSILPKQKQFGIWIEYNQDLKHFIKHKYFQSIWVAFAMPFQYVENNLQPRERIFSGEGQNQPRTIIEALNDSRLGFAKMSPSKKKRHSISELYFKLGTTFMNQNGFQIGLYTGFIFPTFGHQDPEFTFSPFLGHNRHFGVLIGANFQLALNCDTDVRLIALIFSIENQYFVRNFQHRTFDLRFKPWSRYLLLNDKNGNMNISAANVLSPRCKVEPFNFVDLAAGFRVQAGWLEAEVGYSLWAHPDEQVKLEKPFPKGFGIAGNGALVPGTNIGATASQSTIAELAPNDLDRNGNPAFVEIQERDLNFRSAAARAAVASRVFANIGFVHDECIFALFWGIGGFIEFPQNNTALHNWGAWTKVSCTF